MKLSGACSWRDTSDSIAEVSISPGVRSFVLRHPITIFEIGQAVIAFGLASYGVLVATHGSIARPLGASFMVLAAICYWGALSRELYPGSLMTPRHAIVASRPRGAALLLAGNFLLFPADLQIPFLCAAAAAATFAYMRTCKLTTRRSIWPLRPPSRVFPSMPLVL
jgi:hypothetical protein